MSRFCLFICLMLGFFMFCCQSDLSVNSVKLSPETFKDSINNIDVQIIDVRTLKEYRENHIVHALNINYFSEKFADSVSLLDNKKPVFIYCRSGKRSAKSLYTFKEAGFNEIYELEGGILNWKKESFKTMSK